MARTITTCTVSCWGCRPKRSPRWPKRASSDPHPQHIDVCGSSARVGGQLERIADRKYKRPFGHGTSSTGAHHVSHGNLQYPARSSLPWIRAVRMGSQCRVGTGRPRRSLYHPHPVSVPCARCPDDLHPPRAAEGCLTPLRLCNPVCNPPPSFPKPAVPRPSREGTVETSRSPILICLSRPRSAALRATVSGGRRALGPQPSPPARDGRRRRAAWGWGEKGFGISYTCRRKLVKSGRFVV